ncbi:MAG: glycosyl transferase family protein [Mucilaginibacter sp.]|nr:glycosyl transferase family protein [Mucilaginibacter sp.]
MSPGKLLYNIYYAPKARLVDFCKRFTSRYKKTAAGKQEMENAATGITEIYSVNNPVVTVNFLTGQKFWYQSIFCLHSLQKVCPEIQINAVFYDDGSLDEKVRNRMTTQFPHSRVISAAVIEEQINALLPAAKYPCIRRLRTSYPHLKKLTDIHAGQKGWQITLDSDMLFFNYPAEIINWHHSPSKALVLQENKQSYGYSQSFMEAITNRSVPQCINVGMTGIQSESIDWDKVEYWVERLTAKKNSYYLEQAITAMLLSEWPVEKLPADTYIVLPNGEAVQKRTGILHHYVADSKFIYFSQAWKQIL